MSNNTSTCPHCGMHHQTTCQRIRRIEYNPDGSVKSVELHSPREMYVQIAPQPDPWWRYPNTARTAGPV